MTTKENGTEKKERTKPFHDFKTRAWKEGSQKIYNFVLLGLFVLSCVSVLAGYVTYEVTGSLFAALWLAMPIAASFVIATKLKRRYWVVIVGGQSVRMFSGSGDFTLLRLKDITKVQHSKDGRVLIHTKTGVVHTLENVADRVKLFEVLRYRVLNKGFVPVNAEEYAALNAALQSNGPIVT